ncbi:hypothetical protein ACFYW9_19105 [Streptomyces sp. NPDC002698]|uniref:hypothetical protein n=1 Tax=Streptomyces sp. NPDC002698 TaxID=3364660 RepID=UPI0036C157D0
MTRKQRQAHYAEQREIQAEREAKRARFKSNPKGITDEMRRRALEADHKSAMRQKVSGLRPLGAPKRLGPVSGLANLMVAGVDQADAGDVFGHNERQRAQLPVSNLRPQTPGTRQVKAPVDVKRVMSGKPKRKKREEEPKGRRVHGNHFVAEVPDRLKKYVSA